MCPHYRMISKILIRTTMDFRSLFQTKKFSNSSPPRDLREDHLDNSDMGLVEAIAMKDMDISEGEEVEMAIETMKMALNIVNLEEDMVVEEEDIEEEEEAMVEVEATVEVEAMAWKEAMAKKEAMEAETETIDNRMTMLMSMITMMTIDQAVVDKDILKGKEIIKIRNKLQDKKAIKGDTTTTKRSLTMSNMKIKETTKMIKDTQIGSPTMKEVEDVGEVIIEKERKAIEIRKNEEIRN